MTIAPTDIYARYTAVRHAVDTHIATLAEQCAPLQDALDAAQQRLDELEAERATMPGFLERALVDALDTGDKTEVDALATRQRGLAFDCDHAKIGVYRAKLALERARYEYLKVAARDVRLELGGISDQRKAIERARNLAAGSSESLNYGLASSAEAMRTTEQQLARIVDRVTRGNAR